jgi:hypothetical protein
MLPVGSRAAFAVSLLLACIGKADAQGFIEQTYLLDVTLGSKRSQIVEALSYGGYELSGGTRVRFSDWYDSGFVDLNIRFLTQIDPAFGLTWGFSTGQSGEKYTIAPGIWIGAIFRAGLTANSSVTFSATTMLGGNLRERACLADYGEIGGIARVNCRLAASVLPPAETLDYLVREKGSTETAFSVVYEVNF